jgi:broad specificity phosphatase PhoE
LVRHGESLGNCDETVYCSLPDWKIPITAKGREQAADAARKIKELIGDEPVSFMCSPYLRTKQTLAAMMPEFSSNPLVGAREEPRLTEQQFGNYQDAKFMKKCKKDRNSFGRFYYRFPNGESGLDVYNRVTLFIGTLFRDWEKESLKIRDTNIILVTHGLSLRLFLMRWFQFTVQEFEDSQNPDNGAVVVMTRSDLHIPETLRSNLAPTESDMPRRKRAQKNKVERIIRQLYRMVVSPGTRSFTNISRNEKNACLDNFEVTQDGGNRSNPLSVSHCVEDNSPLLVSSSGGRASGYVIDHQSMHNMRMYVRQSPQALLQTCISEQPTNLPQRSTQSQSLHEKSLGGISLLDATSACDGNNLLGKSFEYRKDQGELLSPDSECDSATATTGTNSPMTETSALTSDDTNVDEAGHVVDSEHGSQSGVAETVGAQHEKSSKGICTRKEQMEGGKIEPPRMAVLMDLAGNVRMLQYIAYRMHETT